MDYTKIGRRQAEIKRRIEEDEIFRQIVGVHQETVDGYLEDIVLESIHKTATMQARNEVQEYAKKVDQLAHSLAER